MDRHGCVSETHDGLTSPENVMQYASRLTRMTEMDVIDFSDSVVNRRGVRDPLTPTCLCPMGVIYAASMELGMLTERIAKRAGSDLIEFTGP